MKNDFLLKMAKTSLVENRKMFDLTKEPAKRCEFMNNIKEITQKMTSYKNNKYNEKTPFIKYLNEKI